MKKSKFFLAWILLLIGIVLTGCFYPAIAPTESFVIFPLNNATGVATQVALQWTASTGSAPIKYEVFFSTNPIADVLISPVEGVEATTIQSPLLLPNTTYYWKVAAKNSGGWFVSSTWRFTTLITGAPPSAPITYSPTYGVTGLSTPVALYWNAATSGTAPIVYDVFLDTASNPTTKIVDGTNLLMATNANLLPNTTYYWKVVARNAQGSASSSIWHFTTRQIGTAPSAPVNLSPSNAATAVSLTPLLNWQPSTGTAPILYDVFLGNVPNPITKVAQDVSGNSFTSSALSAATVYYWRVEARNLIGGPITSLTTSFTTRATITDPGTPVNLYPENSAAGIPLQVYLVWQKGSGSDPITYDIYFGTTSSPTATIGQDVSDTQFPSPILTPNTTYYWRIEAQNSQGITIGRESSFTTQLGTAPGTPTNLYPAPLATGIPLQVYLVWEKSTGNNPMTYDVYFGTTPTPATRIGVDVSQTNFPSPILSSNTTYYWYVIAKNAYGTKAGIESSFSTAGGSGVVASNLVLVAPTNGQTLIPLSTTLTWSCQGTLPITYHLWFGETPSLSNAGEYKGITTTPIYSLTGLTQGKTYYWKVFAANAYGAGIVSSVYSFSTLSTSPGGPIYLEKLPSGNGFQVKSTSYFTPASPFVLVFESPTINITNMTMLPDFTEKENFDNFSVIHSLSSTEITSKLSGFSPTNLVLFTVTSSVAGTIRLNDFVSGADIQVDPTRESVTLSNPTLPQLSFETTSYSVPVGTIITIRVLATAISQFQSLEVLLGYTGSLQLSGVSAGPVFNTNSRLLSGQNALSEFFAHATHLYGQNSLLSSGLLLTYSIQANTSGTVFFKRGQGIEPSLNSVILQTGTGITIQVY